MTRLIYFKPSLLEDKSLRAHPGMDRFARIVDYIYGLRAIPVDRTGTIRTPVRMLPLFPIPTFKRFTHTYEDICDDRARDILARSRRMDVPIFVLWSGGIDSTCVLVSLLKQADKEQKKNITVLLSRNSIAENPRFYEDHIRGKLRADSSTKFAHFIGTDVMLVSGEHNDMVMGAAQIGSLMRQYGDDTIHRPYDHDLMTSFFTQKMGNDRESAELYVSLTERVRDAAPIQLSTNFDVLWWMTFAVKWQFCFAYALMFTLPRNAAQVTKEYLETTFVSFYNTDEFQLWSMNNLDKRIKDTWKTYKWIVKDIIYKYNKDEDYRKNKAKVRSLPAALNQQYIHYDLLDENYTFRGPAALDPYIDNMNDFAA